MPVNGNGVLSKADIIFWRESVDAVLAGFQNWRLATSAPPFQRMISQRRLLQHYDYQHDFTAQDSSALYYQLGKVQCQQLSAKKYKAR